MDLIGGGPTQGGMNDLLGGGMPMAQPTQQPAFGNDLMGMGSMGGGLQQPADNMMGGGMMDMFGGGMTQ